MGMTNLEPPPTETSSRPMAVALPCPTKVTLIEQLLEGASSETQLWVSWKGEDTEIPSTGRSVGPVLVSVTVLADDRETLSLPPPDRSPGGAE